MRGNKNKPARFAVLVESAHQRHGDVVEFPPGAARIPHSILPSCTKRVDLVDEKKGRLARCRVCEGGVNILAGRPDPAIQQLWRGNVDEVKTKFSRRSSCQKCFTCASQAIKKNSISRQTITLAPL